MSLPWSNPSQAGAVVEAGLGQEDRFQILSRHRMHESDIWAGRCGLLLNYTEYSVVLSWKTEPSITKMFQG